MRWLLDTDACIWIIRERDPIFSRVAAISPDDLAISSMTEAELRYGARNSAAPDRGRQRVDALLLGLRQVLPFDSEAAAWHAEIRYAVRAQPIGDRDLVIASVAVANGLTLVTRNQREFGRVPNLATEDWMAP